MTARKFFQVKFYFRHEPNVIVDDCIMVGSFDQDTATEAEIKLDDNCFFWIEEPHEIINLLGKNSKESFVVVVAIPGLINDDNHQVLDIKNVLTYEGIWSFIGEYYPNYTACDEIAYLDDLQKIIDGELTGNAVTIFNDDFCGNLETVKKQAEITNDGIYKKTFEYYYKEAEEVKKLKEGLVKMSDIYETIMLFFLHHVTETVKSSDLYESIIGKDFKSLPLDNSDVKFAYFNRLKLLTEVKNWLVEFYSHTDAVKEVVESMKEFEPNVFSVKKVIKVKEQPPVFDKEDYLKVLATVSKLNTEIIVVQAQKSFLLANVGSGHPDSLNEGDSRLYNKFQEQENDLVKMQKGLVELCKQIETYLENNQ